MNDASPDTARPNWRSYSLTIVSVLIVIVAPTLPFLFQPTEQAVRSMLVGYGAIVAIPALHILLHELAHTVAAKFLGLKVVQVVVGAGRPLLQFSIGRCLVTLTRNPYGGGACHFRWTSKKAIRLRVGLTILAGPLLDHGLLAFAIVARASQDEWDTFSLPLIVLAGLTTHSAIRGWWYPAPGLSDRDTWRQVWSMSPDELEDSMRLHSASHKLEAGLFERALTDVKDLSGTLSLMIEVHCLWRLHGARRARERLEAAASQDPSLDQHQLDRARAWYSIQLGNRREAERGLELIHSLRNNTLGKSGPDPYLDLAKAAGLAEIGSYRQALLALGRMEAFGHVDDEFQSLRLAYLAFCRRALEEDGVDDALTRARRLRPHCIVRDHLTLDDT